MHQERLTCTDNACKMVVLVTTRLAEKKENEKNSLWGFEFADLSGNHLPHSQA